MALKKRTVIDRVEVLRNGALQVRQAVEIYDSLVTPKPEKLAVTEERIVPAVAAILDGDGNEIEAAVEETTEQVEISDPSQPRKSRNRLDRNNVSRDFESERHKYPVRDRKGALR